MFSASNLNRWAFSASTAAITVVGTFIPFASSPVAAQTTRCTLSTADFNSGTTALPTPIRPTGTVPPVPAPSSLGLTTAQRVNLSTAARNAALAIYPSSGTPNPLFTRYDIEDEGSAIGNVFEFRGRQPNNCQLEVDVRQRNPQSGGRYRVEEIERQLPVVSNSTLPQLPAAVRNRLRNAGFTATRFSVGFIEASIRPNPVQNVPSSGPPITVPVQVFYEIEGTCTQAVPGFCTRGQSGEATINSPGTSLVFELAS